MSNETIDIIVTLDSADQTRAAAVSSVQQSPALPSLKRATVTRDLTHHQQLDIISSSRVVSTETIATFYSTISIRAAPVPSLCSCSSLTRAPVNHPNRAK